jgi:glycosyltransferase involved in cell wall biosynthesis
MIKVLELIDGGFLGGGQAHILSIAGNINKNKFNISIAAKGGQKFESQVLTNKYPFKSIYLPKFFRKKYLNPLKEFCLEEKFDIIHSHGGTAGFYARMLEKQMPEIKTVHTIHGIHYINSRNLFRKYTSCAIEQYLLKYTDFTICVSEADLESAVKLKIADRSKAAVIYNGINIEKFSREKVKSDLLSAKFDLSGLNFVIGNISRFDEQKNQRLIIRAAARLLKIYPELKFIFVGDGEQLFHVQLLAKHYGIQKNIFFEGERENSAEYYSVFDAFVFPSLWEGMPYVLLEAMASGVPVICSDIPCHKEVIGESESALLINPYKVDGLCKKIIELIENPGFRKSLSGKAYERVKLFDEKTMVNKIENIYEEVLNK